MERLTSPNINVDPDTDRFLHAVIGGKEIDWKQSRDSTLNVLINGPTSNGFGKDIFRKMARDLYGRLKAYEDIAELCGGFDRLRELAEADKDGRVVVLPCRQGDELWTYCNHPVKRVYSFTVSDVSTLNGRTVLNTLGLARSGQRTSAKPYLSPARKRSGRCGKWRASHDQKTRKKDPHVHRHEPEPCKLGADSKAALEDKRRCGRGHAGDQTVREVAAGKKDGKT